MTRRLDCASLPDQAVPRRARRRRCSRSPSPACCSRRRCGGRPTRGSSRRWSPKRGWPPSCSDARRRTLTIASPELDDEADRIGAAARRARHASSRRTAASSATRPRRSRRRARWRTTRTRPEVRRRRARTGSAGRSRHSATLNIDMLYVAVAGAASGDRVRARRAAADRRPPSAATGAHRDADRARRRAARRRGASRGCSRRASASASRPIAGVAARYRARRPHAAAPRLRRRRARHGRARAGRIGAGARTPARRAGARSRAHGGDPRRHGRRRHRRRSAGAAAAGERRGAADAEARRRRRSAAPTSRRSGIPAIAELVAGALARPRAARALQLSPPRDPSRTIIARAAPAAGGGAHGVVLVLHDITELRRADQIRRDFVANVSHELRTPLTAIRGYVEALSEGDTERGGAAAVPRDHRAAHAAHGAAGQGSAAAGAARRRPGDARDRRLRHARRWSQAVVADLAPALERAAAARRRRRSRRTPRRVRADPAKLHDALRNLVANAITYAPERIDDPHRRAARDGARIAIVGVGRRAGHSGRGSVARVRALLPRRQVARARSRRHRPRPRDRQAPGRAARRHGARRRTAPSGGARFTITLPRLIDRRAAVVERAGSHETRAAV